MKTSIAALLLSLTLCTLRAAESNVRIDNDQARVLVVSAAPGVKGALHDHKMNRVMVYLDAGRIVLDHAGGKKQIQEFKAGEVLWSPAAGMHTSLNESGHPVKIVEVELKSDAKVPPRFKPAELDPVKVDPKRYKIEFENDQVRVIRAHYGPHEKGVMHEHSLNRVVTFLTTSKLKITSPDGETKIVSNERGDVTWGTHAKHIEENLSDGPFEVVVVEFKN